MGGGMGGGEAGWGRARGGGMGGRPLTYEQIAAGITDVGSDLGPNLGSDTRFVDDTIRGLEATGALVRQGNGWLWFGRNERGGGGFSPGAMEGEAIDEIVNERLICVDAL